MPTPTLIPTPTSLPSPPTTQVVIECIFFDGVVPRSEADEYVQIANQGGSPVNLENWRVTDLSDGSPTLVFPAVAIQVGQKIRVYTNEVHPEWGGFSFRRASSVWNNLEPDTAGLFNAQGQQVSQKSYPPGCE